MWQESMPREYEANAAVQQDQSMDLLSRENTSGHRRDDTYPRLPGLMSRKDGSFNAVPHCCSEYSKDEESRLSEA